MPLGSPGGERQNRVKSVEGLDSALFIDTENRCVGRRLNIQANNVGSLLFKRKGRRLPCNHASDEVEYRNGARHG
jgi:hypothetical protein